jgi:uroporphyrinogen-III synthase
MPDTSSSAAPASIFSRTCERGEVRVLLTRPEAEAERTAAKLSARGVDVLRAPLLRVESVAAEIAAGPWSGLVLSSANAARALAQLPRLHNLVALPVFTVGRATAKAARAAGCALVHCAEGDQRDLVRLIADKQASASTQSGAPLLYLAGEDRAGDLGAALAPHGLDVHTVVVYRAITAATFPAEVSDALKAGRLDGVLHFSRRSAQAYLDCARAAGLSREALAPAHYCISRQAAGPLADAGAAALHIAAHPDEETMVEMVSPPR